MHIAAAVALEDKLLPAIDGLVETFRRLEGENGDVVKSGRTHLQDAVPITLAQEISGWRTSLEKDRAMAGAGAARPAGAGPGRDRRGHRAQRPQGL